MPTFHFRRFLLPPPLLLIYQIELLTVPIERSLEYDKAYDMQQQTIDEDDFFKKDTLRFGMFFVFWL